ncbi:hypothetical protein TGME49_228320 [Toxoplasma gondii ME49]|uniref:Ribosome-binding factor A n=1 Tax=Toxoplasma gondii (strain ATCC 50611 / Me49) TaxID=508771 RepID=S8G6K3_TOXGM|nr:hypothetical protein TGME49_228320 [Toxoplasma gondii ME49]EPT27305.1 hypothetical protein TGME49_228320 [Toxoplasma gondii ME49]|eukprot:XP_018636098.1 hypothetical protein TGME49_228320 [Toxoplasma gondii ME49]
MALRYAGSLPSSAQKTSGSASGGLASLSSFQRRTKFLYVSSSLDVSSFSSLLWFLPSVPHSSSSDLDRSMSRNRSSFERTASSSRSSLPHALPPSSWRVLLSPSVSSPRSLSVFPSSTVSSPPSVSASSVRCPSLSESLSPSVASSRSSPAASPASPASRVFAASPVFFFCRRFASRSTRRQRERLEENLLSESFNDLVAEVEKTEAAAPLTRATRTQNLSPSSPSSSSSRSSSSRGESSSFWDDRAEGFSQELSLLHRGRRRDRVGEKILDGCEGDEESEGKAEGAGEDEGVGNVEKEVRRRRRLLRAAQAERGDATRGQKTRHAASSLAAPSGLAPVEYDEHESASLSDRDLAAACDFVAPPSASSSAPLSSLSAAPYRLLTHEEAKEMQEAYSERLFEDRRRRWLRMYGLPNPEREARLLLRENEERERLLQEQEEVPALVGESAGYNARIEKMVRDTKRDELVSRIRAKIREEKLANAKLMKAPAPNVAGHIVDAIKYHVARRTVRLGRLIQAQLEEFLTWNSPHMLYSVLDGAAVSIHHVEQRTTKSVCYVYYTLTSSHDPEDVQRRLERAAPQFRMQIARRLQLGYTPEIRFLPQPDGELFNKHRLFKLTSTRRKADMHGGQSYAHAPLRDDAGDRESNFQVLKGGWTKAMHGF